MMTQPLPGEVDVRLLSRDRARLSKPLAETPFRIAVMGDFTGRVNRAATAPIGERRPVFIDRDAYGAVMAGFRPEVHLTFADTVVQIRVRELDDFHPDRLVETLPVFQELRETLRALDDPRKVEHAAARVRAWTGAEDPPSRPSAAPENARPLKIVPNGDAGGVLDRILDEAEGDAGTAVAPAGRSDWDRFLNRIAAPHRVDQDDPRQAALKSVVSEMMSDILRRILHHPDFQRLEALWRGVHRLVSDLETDERLEVHLIDISRAELAADLGASDDVGDSVTFRLLVEEAVRTPGADPWAVTAGGYTFGGPEDVAFLARMARISAMAGAPFLAGADSRLIGCASVVETPDPDDWAPAAGNDPAGALEALRRAPEAACLGLAMPRVLLRMPYGKKTDPTERLDFEEMGDPPAHGDYLWGDPALFCVGLLGRAFVRDGWDLRPGRDLEVRGLPLHVFREKGEAVVKPCAEVLLTERAAFRMMGLGVMPLLSIKHQDAVRLGRFQSLADPPTRLAGRWETHE